MDTRCSAPETLTHGPQQLAGPTCQPDRGRGRPLTGDISPTARFPAKPSPPLDSSLPRASIGLVG
jgi:hypothetical protein